MGVLRYVLMRVGWMVFVFFGITTLTFVITNLVPADPAKLAAGLEARGEQVEQMRRLMGLDQPLSVQYVRYVTRLLRGDFGLDARSQRPVADQLRQY
ncbi:MAG: ABC transporter permease, partial [Armatimonadetes bacterium]|nr:ABC transporter permease [Armatimonadota bacterium]